MIRAISGAGGRPMIRISLPYLIEMSQKIERLNSVTSGPYLDYASIFYGAQSVLEQFLDGSIYSPSVRSARNSGLELLQQIRTFTGDTDYKRIIAPWEIGPLQNAVANFRTIWISELGVWPSYFVTPKGGFDTLSLLDSGESLFPSSLVQKVPEALFDAQEATKALAFELSTASGYHVYRCLEAVLRRYWDQVCNGKAAPKVRSIGVYVAAMERFNIGDPKVLAALKQINQLHRNPLIHPEVALDTDELITVLGIARSAISAMLQSLPDAAFTTTTKPTS